MRNLLINIFQGKESNTSIENAKISLEKRNWKISSFETIYFPYLFSIWNIEYLSLVKIKQKAKIVIASNLVTGESSFSDKFVSSLSTDINPHCIISFSKDTQSILSNTKELIRKYYIYHVRVWNLPSINLMTQEYIYLPYSIMTASKRKKNELFIMEHVSGTVDKLSKYPFIFQEFNNLYEGRKLI